MPLISPTKVHKTETTAQAPPSSPSQAPTRVSESPKIPHVELRHVEMAKSNRPVSGPPIQLVIAPLPPSSPAPLTPPPPVTPPPAVLLKTNGTTQKGLYRATLSLHCLQRRRTLSARVYVFVLGRHLGFGTCGGLERGKICRESRREVEKISRGEEKVILGAPPPK